MVETVEVDGLRIGYQQEGHGPPLILLHGAFGDSRIWRWQLEGLSDEFTVVAWDAPGCGRSDNPPSGLTDADLGDALAGFLQAVGVTEPHVLGLSGGSGMALQLYRRHPRVPRSLVLASAYAGWAGSLPPAEVEKRFQQVLQEIDQTPEQFIPSWIPTLLTDKASASVVTEVAAIMAQFHPAGMKALLEASARADYRDVLPTISVPTLLLCGEADRRASLHVANGLHQRIPGSTLVVMPNVGHLSNVEAPELFNAEVRTFLRSLPQTHEAKPVVVTKARRRTRQTTAEEGSPVGWVTRASMQPWCTSIALRPVTERSRTHWTP